MRSRRLRNIINAAMQSQDQIPFRCIKCDYDLRGLAGDPVQCPECGHASSPAFFLALLERNATQAAQAGLNSGLLLIPMSFFAAPLALGGTYWVTAPPFGLILLIYLWETRAAMRCAKWSTGGWLNVFELQIAVLVTLLAAVAGVLGCWMAAAHSFGLGALLPASAPFRVPVTYLVAGMAIVLSLLATYGAVLCATNWTIHSYTRMKGRCYALLLRGG